MILYRAFALEPGEALTFPREHQGSGRHDNPQEYGCLYLSDTPVASVVEQLQSFRGQLLTPWLLVQRGRPLGLATIDLDAELVDLDDPGELKRLRLRPSLVATRNRTITQPQALALWEAGALGIRWWSAFESTWANVTLFDRAADRLRLVEERRLDINDPVVRDAADFLGLAP